MIAWSGHTGYHVMTIEEAHRYQRWAFLLFRGLLSLLFLSSCWTDNRQTHVISQAFSDAYWHLLATNF